jgi:hypothetical protein
VKESTATTLARMEEKIDGINEHLVRLNGSIIKHGQWMECHDKDTTTRIKESAENRSANNVRWGIAVIVGTALLGLTIWTIQEFIKSKGG